ncbi:MAG TPA: FkbM family methyltransferase [Thermoleophilaceae bacterium]|nr:FkbM family methyltransferase [Thermoleophilaceae bacterium]
MGLRYRAELALELATNRSGRREEVMRELFFRAARRFTPAMAAPTDYGVMWVPTSDVFVGADLFTRRGADADAIGEAIELIERHARPVRRGLFVEIGANIGSTTVPALRRYGFERVLAAEPLPANVDLLRQNLFANGVAERATVIAAALSESDGTMSLQVAPENSGDNRLVNRDDVATPGSYGEHTRSTIDVEVRSWDSLVERGELSAADVDLVWIDVQGHEGQVLAGASTLLEARLPVVMELWPYGLRRAGGLELVERLVAESYERIVDMHSHDEGAGPELLPASAIASVAARLGGIANTDLILLPDQPSSSS